jgi:hypothetical protein
MICRFVAFLRTRMSRMNEPSQETINLTTDMNQFPVVPGGSVETILVLTIETERNHDNNRPSY